MLKTLPISKKLFATLVLISLSLAFGIAGFQTYVHQVRFDKKLFAALTETSTTSSAGLLFAHEKHHAAASEKKPDPPAAPKNQESLPEKNKKNPSSYTQGSFPAPAAPPPASLLDDKDFQWLLTFTHIHSFSMAFVFFFAGAIYVFSSASERVKCFWIVLPFVGIAVDLSSQWLRMFSGETWGIGSYVGGMMMGAAFIVYVSKSLHTLWIES